MEAKKRLARTITAGFHGEAAAASADENWARMFQQKEAAEDLEEVAVAYADVAGPEPGQIRLPKLLVQLGLAASGAEANRKIAEKAVKLDGEVAESALISSDPTGATRGAARQAGQGCGDCVNWRFTISQMAYTGDRGMPWQPIPIPDVLGGEVVLGRPMNKGGALAELVREGLPVKALLLLAERLDIRQAEISEKIGIPKRTLTRRLTQHSRLTAAESDRAVRLAQVYANAAETLGERRQGRGLAENAQPRFAWRTPAGPVGHGPGRA